MTIIYPEATAAFGNTSVVGLLTLSSTSAPSLAADFTAANSLNISCFLYGTGFDAAGEQAKGNAPRRVCDTTQREQFGPTNFTITDIQYAYDPQAADTVDANKAKAFLDSGLELWLAERLGKPSKTNAIAAGDKVNLHHVRLGRQNRGRTGDDEFAEYAIMQGLVYIEDPIEDIAVAA